MGLLGLCQPKARAAHARPFVPLLLSHLESTRKADIGLPGTLCFESRGRSKCIYVKPKLKSRVFLFKRALRTHCWPVMVRGRNRQPLSHCSHQRNCACAAVCPKALILCSFREVLKHLLKVYVGFLPRDPCVAGVVLEWCPRVAKIIKRWNLVGGPWGHSPQKGSSHGIPRGSL